MGNVLDNISKDNTRFTIFENNQVLTADQLNDLFNYLDVQTRTTRTRAIGVGIICGLELGVLENRHVVLSTGTAISTDGDLLSIDYDQEFDQYEVFEDLDSKYPYFQLADNQRIPLYELRNSQLVGSIPGLELSTLESTTGTAFRDYVGMLYLENYNSDPDLCTGTDCDNKGITSVKNLKVLLVHKNNAGTLLQTMPAMNKDYFALEDIDVPRVTVSTAIDTFTELNASFNNALSIKDDIKNKLIKAYQVCQSAVEEEFDNGDPTSGWSTLLDQHFTAGNSTSTQYIYDFARDISQAYNEMRESLFSDDMLCCPDVDLFPKHVLLGLVRDARIKNPIVPIDISNTIPLDIPSIPTRDFPSLLNPRPSLFKNIRFNIGTFIKRFNKIHVDLEYRHHFYESPILNNNDEVNEFTKFSFMRLHSMITNFKVPTAEEVQNLDTGLKITPSYYEDVPLGERSIPFYYKYNPSLPLNLYWNFKANTRKKENQILSYNSNAYAGQRLSTIAPLTFSILKYNFFRIEGHIGFGRAEVEAAMNKLILDNNLPINIQSVQVEKKLETIPPRPWFFPHLYMYEKSIKSTFIDRLDDGDLVNDNLKLKDSTVPVTEFKTAKQNVLDNNRDIGDPQFNYLSYRNAITNMRAATVNVKAQTRKYTFSNTSTPHDFILNSDILRKTDVISGIYQNTLIQKRTGLMLGNYMKDNPGLEHNGGVLRGGTFVLVYTADDQKVVADFMLPYANIDKDIVPNPPVYTPPIIPLPPNTEIIPRFPIDDVFEIKPYYERNFDEKILPYVKELDIDDKVNSKIQARLPEIEQRLDLKVSAIKPQLDGFEKRMNENSLLFNSVLTKDLRTVVPNTGTVFGSKDLTVEIEKFNRNRKILEETPLDAPGRDVLEKTVFDDANDLTEKLNDPIVTGNEVNSLAVKGIIADVHTSTSLIQNLELKTQSNTITERLNTINKNLRFNR
jgi:hypothetical protein